MKSKFALFLIFLLTILLASCNPKPAEPTSVPTLEIINLQIIPELEHWMPKISQCANAIEGSGIYTDVLTQTKTDISQADLVLRLGQRKESDPYVAVIGFEEMVLIVGSEIPLNSLSIESIQAIFSGEISNWREVQEVIQQDSEVNQPIQTLSYPEGNILYSLFIDSFLESQPIKSNPILFSTPEGLNWLLQENPNGIAYLFKSRLPDNHEPLMINGFDPLSAQQYVLAITNAEPNGKLKQLLLCLQDSE